MEIFDRDGKFNFVDENNVVLGYDNGNICCEFADYYIVDFEPTMVVSNLAETCRNQNYIQEGHDLNRRQDNSLEGYNFDTKFFKQLDDNPEGDQGEPCGAVCFRIVKEKEQKFIVLFNAQNGYYGHGFEFKEGNEFIQEGTL